MNAKPIRCLIVDDEPSAQELLKQYVADTPQLELVDTCDDALEARERLGEEPVDLLLLDINMPKLSGIGLLRSISDPPAVILTTAYDEYALEGYELDVVDYLLKPFSFERFLKAISKVEERLNVRINGGSEYMLVKADRKTYKVNLNDILYIESMGDYVTIVTRSKRLTAYHTLKNLESELPGDRFLRIHKSYIIALPKVEYLEGNSVGIADEKIPVGTTYRERVKGYFRGE